MFDVLDDVNIRLENREEEVEGARVPLFCPLRHSETALLAASTIL
jgi:hypothetical protein